MQLAQLLKRSLTYYWRTNLAVVLGVAVAVAVLAGALLVGDSVRESLRSLVAQRLGHTSFVITSNAFVREQLADEIASDPGWKSAGFYQIVPLITLRGSVTHEQSKRVASGIQVYGVDDRFWKFHERTKPGPQNRTVYVSPGLVTELGSNAGDSIVLQIEKPSDIPLESLHSKKDSLGKTLRLNVGDTLSADDLGEFSLQAQQSSIRAVFVSLQLLQKEIEQPNKVNLILVSELSNEKQTASADLLTKLLRQKANLQDIGINLRQVNQDNQNEISLETDSKVIVEPLAKAAEQTAETLNIETVGVLSYLANNISSGDHSIPYSLITALDDVEFQRLSGNKSQTNSATPPIVLNEWAAKDLSVQAGAPVKIEYYLWHDGGHLEIKTADFVVAGVVPISGIAADRNLVPDYPGISGTENLSDWDPPFPVDLKRIRDKDEDYWHQYRTTPKAFVPLSVGQTLWQSRFGKLTSIRLKANSSSINSFAHKLQESLSPATMGVLVTPVRAEGLQASRGATDFGEYFLYFSFFLVVSALLLTSLFFKLGIEQRVREIGTLRAIGFDPATIRMLFLYEGIILAAVGSLLGLIGSIIYGQLMMLGLKTWWIGAVGTTQLTLHASPTSLFVGAAGGVIAALVCVALTLRGLKKQSVRSLLSGVISSSSAKMKSGKSAFLISLLLGVLAIVVLIAAGLKLIGEVAGFFIGGTLLLAAALFYQSSLLRRRKHRTLSGRGWWSIARVGFRNAMHRPGRSTLCIALIAAASFIVVAVDSFRHREGGTTLERKSGTGGYPLLAESIVPLVQDPNSPDGREALNLADDNPQSVLNTVTLTRFRVLPGDDASCLNLYQPRKPKIIAPTADFLASNRFRFQSSVAADAAEKENPWLLLNRQFSDGAIPIIADANSLAYVLHLKLGEDFVFQQGDQPIHLRVVAALEDSLFQSELLISENNFIRLFPDQQGYRFFLIDLADPNRTAEATAMLEDRLADDGFDVQSTAERLASFHRVENTYLSTFQSLGALGLILGTIGLAAVLLRNVLERRQELALMRAVGYNTQHFVLMIIAENALLLFAGVFTGSVCALLAIAPVLMSRHGGVSIVSLGLLLLAVLVSGLVASIAATWTTVRLPLLATLKAE